MVLLRYYVQPSEQLNQTSNCERAEGVVGLLVGWHACMHGCLDGCTYVRTYTTRKIKETKLGQKFQLPYFMLHNSPNSQLISRMLFNKPIH